MIAYYDFLTILLRQTGELIMSYRPKMPAISEKSAHEIVTLADTEANNLLTDKLKETYPDIAIYSEEGEKHEGAKRWIIDPLDGTTPWVWGNSGFSISVALEENGEITLGAIYDPVMKEFFYAQKGKGARRNEQPIHTSAAASFDEMLFVVDWGNADGKRKEGLTYFQKFFIPKMVARRVVPQFAPALGLCRIAEGRIHGLICNDTWMEDHAAGSLILQEAGGSVSNFFDTKKFDHRQTGIIAAANAETHQKLITFLTENA